MVTLALSVNIQNFGLSDPFHVTMEILVQLRTLSCLLELSARLGLLSLLSELPVQKSNYCNYVLPHFCSLAGTQPTETPQLYGELL